MPKPLGSHSFSISSARIITASSWMWGLEKTQSATLANFESPMTLFPGLIPIQHSPRIGTKWCEHADLTEIGPTV